MLIPNSFQVPNIFVDKLLPYLKPSDTKIILFICRKTYGWQKSIDRISLSQFEKGTGLSSRLLIDRLKVLVESGILVKEPSKIHGDSYAVNIEADLDQTAKFLRGEESSPGVVKKVHHGGEESSPLGGEESSYTETHYLNPLLETQDLFAQSDKNHHSALPENKNYEIPFKLPCVDGFSFPVTTRDLSLWEIAYPGVDVPGEIRKMIAWLDANPRNKKTRAGIKRFCVSWLSKAQNSAPTAGRGNSASPEAVLKQNPFDNFDSEAFKAKVQQKIQDEKGRYGEI